MACSFIPFGNFQLRTTGQEQDAYLPRKPFCRAMPLEHLPENHRTRKYVGFVIVLRMGVPKLWSLPIHRPDNTPNHRSRRLLDLC